MTYFVSCFVVGLFATLFIMRSSMRHGHLSADHDLSGPQKFHAHPVPRVGGAGVMVAVVVGVVVAQFSGSPDGKCSVCSMHQSNSSLVMPFQA